MAIMGAGVTALESSTFGQRVRKYVHTLEDQNFRETTMSIVKRLVLLAICYAILGQYEQALRCARTGIIALEEYFKT